jgi:hypothetical protein
MPKLIQGGGLSLNKEKIASSEMMIDAGMLLYRENIFWYRKERKIISL